MATVNVVSGNSKEILTKAMNAMNAVSGGIIVESSPTTTGVHRVNSNADAATTKTRLEHSGFEVEVSDVRRDNAKIPEMFARLKV